MGALEKNVQKSMLLYIGENFFFFNFHTSSTVASPFPQQSFTFLVTPSIKQAWWCRVGHCMTQDRLKNRCLGSRLADRLAVVLRLSSTDPWFFNLRRTFFLNVEGLAYVCRINLR